MFRKGIHIKSGVALRRVVLHRSWSAIFCLLKLLALAGAALLPAAFATPRLAAPLHMSHLQGPPDMIVYGQTNLLKAAQEAGVKKFIPSTFSLNMFNIPEGEHPFLDSRLKFAKILEKSGMPHVHILNGGWLSAVC